MLLSVGTYMNGTASIPYMLSLALGRPDIGLRTNLWAMVIVLPIPAVLIYKFGLVGAGLSWVVYHVFLYVYMIPKVCRECLQARFRHFRVDGSSSYSLA